MVHPLRIIAIGAATGALLWVSSISNNAAADISPSPAKRVRGGGVLEPRRAPEYTPPSDDSATPAPEVTPEAAPEPPPPAVPENTPGAGPEVSTPEPPPGAATPPEEPKASGGLCAVNVDPDNHRRHLFGGIFLATLVVGSAARRRARRI